MTRGFYWRLVTVIVAALAAWTILWPSMPRIAPPWIQRVVHARMNLGLDIRGGARLSYEVMIGQAIADRRDRAIDNIREQLARDLGVNHGEARMTEAQSNTLGQRVTVRRNDVDNRELSIHFNRPADVHLVSDAFLLDRGLTRRPSSDSNTIVAAIRQDQVTALETSAVEQAKLRIENRIDELGVRETSITSRGETVVVEVPGSDRTYFNQIQEIIRRTAHLEFRMCADDATFLDPYDTGGANASHLPATVTTRHETVSAGQTADGQTTHTASPLYFVSTGRGPDALRAMRDFLVSIRSTIPDTYDVLIGEDETEARQTRLAIPTDRKIWRTYTVEHIANVTGDMIREATTSIKPDTNEPYVSLTFKPDGTRAFAAITSQNIKRRFAIILDDRVQSAPVINDAITSGSASITIGSGDHASQMREAEELVTVLRAGALPAPLSEGTMDFIGPTLGRDTIRGALTAAGIGMGLVLLFMAIWYGSAGLIADGAVILNLGLQLAAIALLGATMTLPGFAGLALTVGMAVDSNVLINERIREELRSGKSLRAAVDAGYEHAFTAIIDGHVTTFISGVVLLQYGTGPVKGFAVTLIIGIVVNLFTGVFATRVVFDWLVRGLRVKKLSLG